MSDKSLKPENELDGVCLEFEQCSECVKMDGCDLDADFMPKLNGTKFECDHLIGSPCQEMFQQRGTSGGLPAEVKLRNLSVFRKLFNLIELVNNKIIT